MKRTDLKRIMLVLLVFAGLPSVLGLGLGTFESVFSYTPDQTSTIQYFIVKEAGEKSAVNLDFSGTLREYAEFRFDHFWYSTRLDKLDVYLQREFDLTGVGSATLTFYTKYDIEYGWDFGYVEVSTNNGSSWNQLQGTGTTTYRDAGAYVGVPGAHAYTGSVSGWTLETVDLSSYAGEKILLRFRYVTDWYWAENGWLVDDISIPEIGFYDAVGSTEDGWETDGWLHNVLFLEESSRTVPFYIDFVIPDNYSYHNSSENITLFEIPGIDQGFNSGQGAVSLIVVHLPPIVKTVPVTPPTSGGGGGAPPQRYYQYQGRIINYFAQKIWPDYYYPLSLQKSGTILDSIRIFLSDYALNVWIRIEELDSEPGGIKQHLKKVYRYFEIVVQNIPSEGIRSVLIRFSVSRDWIDGLGEVPENVVLSRYSEGKWDDLNTLLVEERWDEFVFEAESPGFSYFAVRIKEPFIEAIIEPEPTPKPNITDLKPLMIVAGNESAEDVIAGVWEDLQRKTRASDEEMEAVLGPKPARSVKRPAWIGAGLFALIVVILSLVVFIICNKRRFLLKVLGGIRRR